MTESVVAIQPWQYVVAMPQPENHFIHVQLTISDWQEKYLDLHLPVWSLARKIPRLTPACMVTWLLSGARICQESSRL